MYQCITPKKGIFFMVLAAVAAALIIVLTTVGKALAAPEKVPEGIFLPVIMYHSIREPASDYQLSPAALESDLQYLKSHGYESVSVAQLLAYTQGTGTLPEKPVLLTFDDGFYNNYSDALPLLDAYNMQAVVSIVGRYTDELAPADPENALHSYLTWDNVRSLLASNRIELGSHTYDLHSNEERAGCSILLGEDPAQYRAMLQNDLIKLQTQAKNETGTSPVVFAYPYGFICRESIPVLKDMGFVCTLTCREEPNYITQDPDCLYGLGRYHRSPQYSTEAFFAKALAAQTP